MSFIESAIKTPGHLIFNPKFSVCITQLKELLLSQFIKIVMK